MRKAARDPQAVALASTTFDVQFTQGDVCDQERSGRCWMFASLNTMRFRIMKKLKLKTFELSQSYPLFWDKYERCNWFFEHVIETAGEPLASRDIAFLLADPLCDGGQWDMFASLVKKYGVVPKEAMPETACSSNTGDLDGYPRATSAWVPSACARPCAPARRPTRWPPSSVSSWMAATACSPSAWASPRRPSRRASAIRTTSSW